MRTRLMILALATAALLAATAPAAAHISGVNINSHGVAANGVNVVTPGHPWNGPNVPARPNRGAGHGPNQKRR